MDAYEIDEAIGIVEQYLYGDEVPSEVYKAWSLVADAADRYAGVLD